MFFVREQTIRQLHCRILSEVKKGDVERVSFKICQVRKFFPNDWSTDQMKREILVILRKNTAQNYEKQEEKKMHVCENIVV